MSAQSELWPYPIIGAIAVMKSGARIQVQPPESDDPRCFTGQMIDPEQSDAYIAVHGKSVFWDRSKIVRTEHLSTI